MSEVCKRGYKCMCFQCSEQDCENYQPEMPEWLEELIRNGKSVQELITEIEKGGSE